jgi:hypothetical protein
MKDVELFVTKYRDIIVESYSFCIPSFLVVCTINRFIGYSIL